MRRGPPLIRVFLWAGLLGAAFLLIGSVLFGGDAVAAGASVPGAPRNVAGTPGNQTVALTWRAPSSDGGAQITSYRITPYIGSTAQTPINTGTSGLSYTVTGLTNGTAYTFTVAATNSAGTGPDSNPTGALTPASPPDAPTGVTGTPGNRSVALSWTAPASNGGSPVTRYRITPYIGSTAQTPVNTASAATSYTVTGLTNGTTYTFTVAATNSAGTGPDSSPSAPITPATVPGAPSGVAGTRGNQSVALTWTAPASNGGAAITSYRITPYIGGTAQTPVNTGAAATSYTVTGLTNGTAYKFKVAATNSAGTGADSSASASITPATVPDAPTAVTGTPGNGSVALTWTAPASNGGSPITTYRITPYVGGTAQAPITTGSTATAYTVTGLINGIAYTFTVAAVNSLGGGADSAPSAPFTPATVPGAPTGVGGTAGNGSVALSWTAPASNGGSPITSYRITPYIGSTAQTPINTGSGAAAYTVTGLTNGTAYTFKVAATNGAGTGNDSAASGAFTPAGVPGAPTAVAGTPGNGSVALSWTAPGSNGGSPITSYRITPYIGSTAQTPITTGSAGTSYTVTGLTNGTSYTFTVAATNGVGTGPDSNPSGAMTPIGVPDAPTGVSGTPGNGSVALTWSTPASNGGSPITSYRITPYIGANAQTPITTGSAGTSYTVTGLANGTAYTFTVAATNGVGTGPDSSPSAAMTPLAVPDAPTAVTGTPGNASAALSWTAPASTGGSPITSYRITPYIGAAAQTPITTGSAATAFTVTGLTNGTAYTFKVAATNSVGTGPDSSPSGAMTPATIPDAPTGVTGTAGNASVSLNWSAPAWNGGSPITSYRITPYIGSTAQTPVTTGSTATSYTVTGLANGTAYTFTVAAVNGVGAGPDSSPTGAMTPTGPPDAPTAVTGTPGNASVALSWTAPTSDGGSPVTSYRITPYIGSTAQTPVNTGSTATSYTVTGLANGITYTFRVAATNSAGTGADSAASGAMTPATVPDAPTAVAGTPGNGSAALTWTAPASNGGAAITSYRITPYVGGTAQAPITTGSAATAYTVTGLINGIEYTFTVAAANSVGTGPDSSPSAPIIPAAVPDAPTGVSGTPGNASAALSWTAPAATGGSPITSYRITPYIGSTAQTPVNTGSSTTSFMVTGLVNGTTYTFKVAAANAVGTGPDSSPSAAMTPVGAPDAPTGVAGTAGNTSVALNWTAPASNGGSPITSYRITPYIGSTAQTPVNTGSSTTSFTVTGLTNGTTYTFRVAATNSVGTGPDSAASGPITPTAVPDPPTGVTGTAGNGSVALSWTAPASTGGSPVTSYRITPYIGSTAQTPITTGSTATAYTVTGLTNGTAYTFTVAATNAVGTGPDSSPSAAMTPIGAPDAPTGVSGTPGNGSVALSWTAPASNGGSPVTSYRITPYIGSTAQTPVDTGSPTTSFTVTGLANGTAYTFKVAATNSVGTGPDSNPSPPLIPATVPDAPTALTGTPGNGSVALTWTAPASNGGSPLTTYRITPYVGGTAQAPITTGSPATGYTVTGLINGVAYTFTVAAVNSVGTGPDSSPSPPYTPISVPGAATAVAGTPGNGSVALTWTAPASTGGSAITSYRITPYIGSTAQAPVNTGSPATSFTVTGLANGTAYTFKVAATNGAGTGPDSNGSPPMIPLTVPGAPTGVSGTAGNASVALTWTAPASDGGSPITSYRITPYIGSTAQTPVNTGAPATSYTVTGLANGTTYTFKVAATNSAGTGTDSNASGPLTPAAASLPGAPTGVTGDPRDRAVALSWTAPASDGGASITSYRITPYIGSTAQTPINTGTPSTSYTVTGLTNGTTYTFKVAATNSVGTGPDSAASPPVTPAAGSRYNNPVFADGFESGSTSLWNAPAGTGTTSVVPAAAHAGSFGLRMANASGQYSIIGATLAAPMVDSSTTFWVRFSADAGSQEVAEARDQASSQTMWALFYDGDAGGFWFYPRTASGGPAIFTGPGTAGLNTWIKVEVQYTATSSGGAQLYINGQTQVGWGASGDYTRSTNLQRLAFWNDVANTTDFDDVIVAGAITPPTTVPGPPSGVSGVPDDHATELTWSAPTSGGGAISSYRITPYIGGNAQTPIDTQSPATSYAVTGLTNGTAYTFSVAATNSVGTGAASAASAPIVPAPLNPIQIENRQPGDPNWGDFAGPPTPAGISGYGSRISVNHGQSIDFYVTTTASSVSINVYRMGWYGGAGARLMQSMGSFPGVNQPQALPNATTGMVSENWTRTATLNVPSSWMTGAYIARLSASNGYTSMIFFVVRDDGGTEPIVFQTSTNTYQAYNVYGGTSLYNNNTDHSIYQAAHAMKVSYDRPFLNGNGTGDFLRWEYPFVRWLERQGYNVTYTTNVDTDTNVNPLSAHRAFLSVGHDEYWSKGIRDNVEAAVAAGVNVGFFAGNEAYWQVRYEANASGVPNRVMVGYKDYASGLNGPPGPDPMYGVNNSIVTTWWRDPIVNRPEESLMGVMFGGETVDSDYVVQNASNWVYAGTGFTDGTHVQKLVGYEYDHYFGDAQTPPNTTVLSNTSLVNTENGQADTANAAVHTAPSGATVFAASTIQWSWALDSFGGGPTYLNTGIQRTTANILARFTQ